MTTSAGSALARLFGVARGDTLRARVVRGALGSAGVQAGSRALALVLGVVLARSLGPDSYGIYAYAFAIMSLLMVAAEAGVPTLLLREVAAAEGRGDWGLLRGVLRRGVQVVVVVSVIIATSGLVILALISDRMAPARLYTMALMLLVLPVAALVKTLGHALRGLHRVVMAQALEVLLRPALVIGLVLMVFLCWPDMRAPYTAMAAQIAATATVLIAAAVLLKRALPPVARDAFPQFRTRQWLRSALPFILIGGAMVINNQTDIIMLGWFTTADEVGIYRVAVQGAMLVFFPLQVCQAILAPYFARYYGQNDNISLKSLDRRSRYAIVLATFPVFLSLALFSDSLIAFLFGAAFLSASIPLTILAAGFFLNTTCGASGLLMQMIGRESFTAKVLWYTSTLNFFGNLFLIPLFGSVGAAISTGFTTFAYQLTLRYNANRMVGV